MIATAENVAREAGLSKDDLDAVTALRHAQYADALAEDRALQRRFMVAVEVGSRGVPDVRRCSFAQRTSPL